MTSKMSNIQYIWGKQIEPYRDCDRVKVYYTKNKIDQYAIYMDYGDKGKPIYRIIEDDAVSGNRLSSKEREAIGEMLNNKEIIISK